MNIIPENKRRLTKWLIGLASAIILIFLGIQNIDAVASALSWCAGIAMPLIVGGGISLILNVPMRTLEENLWKNSKNKLLCKIRRPVAFILSLIMIIGIVAGAIMIVLPTLVETVKAVAQSAIELVNRFRAMSEEEILALPFGELLMDIDWDQLLDSLKSWLTTSARSIVNTVFGTVTSLLGSIIDLFVSVAFAIYLLFSKRVLKRQAMRLVRAWLPEARSSWLIHAASVANVNLRNFIAGQFLEALVLAAMCFIGMLIFGFPYAAMISTLVGVTALVPVIGGFIGGGVGAFLILVTDPIKALWFVVYLVVLQQIEGNVVYPRVMGNKVHLSAMWILAAVTIGGGIAGPIGMLIGVPLASTAYVLLKEATERREAERGITPVGEDEVLEATEEIYTEAAEDMPIDGAVLEIPDPAPIEEPIREEPKAQPKKAEPTKKKSKKTKK